MAARTWILLSFLLALVPPLRSAHAELDFLPAFFGEALTLDGHRLQQVKRERENGVDRAVFLSSAGGLLQVTAEQFGCGTPVCDAALENARAFMNEHATKGGGRFVAISGDLLRAEWRDGLVGVNHAFVFRLPRSILFWSVALTPRKLDMDAYFETVEALVDRLRYEQAAAEDNVAMGRWGERIHAHARRLLSSGDKGSALRVLRDLLVTSPSAYAAHLDFAANTTDAEAAKASARAVLAGTEDAAQAAEAARLLGEPRMTFESLPVLERGDTGLQLILIPLPPCDVQMVSEAARIYEQITNVPTKVRRLAGGWAWGEPDRVQGQRNLQSAMVKYRRANIDFSDWDKERYIAELAADAKKYDALSRYFLEDHIRRIEEGPGQYLVDPYLERLLDSIAGYRSGDPRTVYVGVTEANIYGGDSNFLFSAFIPRGQWGASILSYSMMLAKTLGEPIPSRRRLVERLAKEMVPASFKALRIPRPTDPTDPYSYSSGVERLDQKTLTLSPPTRKALDELR